MKSRTITMMLVAGLASLVLTEFASAYYSPGVGRFLGRDPLDEPGAVLIALQHQPTPFLARDAMNGNDRANVARKQPKTRLPRGSGQAMHWAETTADHNLYSFVRCDPVNRIDPLGLQTSPTNWCTRENDRGCCDCLVYAEARGEDSVCKEAVAHVLLNRQNAGWPDFRGETSFCAQAALTRRFVGGGTRAYRDCCRCRDGLPDAEYNAMIASAEACNAAQRRAEDLVEGAQYWFTAGRPPAWMREQERRGNCRRVDVPCTGLDFWQCNNPPR